MTHKYLLIYRNAPAADAKPPSPDEMSAMLSQWQAWKKAFPAILDMGDGLLPTGRTLKGGVVTDGPTVESKEIVSGYSIVSAKDYEGAVEVARACPFVHVPGARIEVRELAGY